jgi:SAM-dependent methyltransferase
MSDWQERITRETAPAIRAEHELRYRVVCPLIGSATAWADLGCGNGLAADAALEGARPLNAVLVDLDAEAVSRACATLELPDAARLSGDLAEPGFLEEVGEVLLAVPGERVVTCFEVVEHLPSFLPLLGWATGLAREHGVTFVLSVPNDAFWSIQNPYHLTAWGEGAFEELSRLLPDSRTLLRQVALTGSTVLDWEASPTSRELTVEAGGPSSVATHFIAAFGPRHAEVLHAARAVQADHLAQRRWERERESNLAVAERRLREQHEQLQSNTRQFDEWRVYIHRLERELGRPPSGGSQPDERQAESRGGGPPA